MALFLQQENERSELQKRIAAELAEKAKKKTNPPQGDRPDGVDDSAYLTNTQKTSSLAWVWIAIGVFVMVGLVWLVVSTR